MSFPKIHPTTLAVHLFAAQLKIFTESEYSETYSVPYHTNDRLLKEDGVLLISTFLGQPSGNIKDFYSVALVDGRISIGKS